MERLTDIRIKRRSLVVVIFLLFISSMYAGGGWPQPKGSGYLKLSEWWLISDQHYTDMGLIDPNLTTAVYNTAIYAEYGFTDRLTGILYFPLFSRNLTYNQVSNTTREILIPGEAINSIGDTDLTIKYGLTNPNNGLAVSASLLFGIPLGQSTGGTLNNLQTGDGEFNQMLRLDAGTGFPLFQGMATYANLYVALNNRTNDFSDEFRFGVEVGAGILNEKLWFSTKLNSIQSFKNGKTSSEILGTTLFANNAEVASLTFEAAYYVTKKVGFSASYGTALSGSIILASPSYSVGVFLDL